MITFKQENMPQITKELTQDSKFINLHTGEELTKLEVNSIFNK